MSSHRVQICAYSVGMVQGLVLDSMEGESGGHCCEDGEEETGAFLGDILVAHKLHHVQTKT